MPFKVPRSYPEELDSMADISVSFSRFLTDWDGQPVDHPWSMQHDVLDVYPFPGKNKW
jgi:hypothetical protein